MTWLETIAKIESYRSLSDDWDGGGQVQPESLSIERALLQAGYYQDRGTEPPQRVLLHDGLVRFEWHSPGYVSWRVEEFGVDEIVRSA